MPFPIYFIIINKFDYILAVREVCEGEESAVRPHLLVDIQQRFIRVEEKRELVAELSVEVAAKNHLVPNMDDDRLEAFCSKLGQVRLNNHW